MNRENPHIPRTFWPVSVRGTLGLIFLAGFAVIVLIFAFWRLGAGRGVDAEVAALRQKGLPADWNDLAKWPMTVPDEQNAAFVFKQAFDMADSNSCFKISKMSLPLRNESITNHDEMATWVGSNAPAMDIIRGITNAASSRYPVDYTAGPNALLPHLGRIKTFAELFAWDAALKSDQKDYAGQIRDIEALLKLSHSLDAEPILISQLVSVAVRAITIQTLERTLNHTYPTDGQLAQLLKDFTAAEPTNQLWMGMVGERASGSELLRLLNDDPRKVVLFGNQGSENGDQTGMPVPNYRGFLGRATGIWVRDRMFFLHAMDTNIAALAAGPPASLQYTNALNKIETNAHSGFYIVSSMLLPAMDKVVIRDADDRARFRTGIAVLAVERWRLTHSGIPDSLSQLVPKFLPAVPIDPYDGQPLRIKKLAKGYVIYSIGPNGQDDGGKERIPYGIKVSPEERNRYDITFTVDR